MLYASSELLPMHQAIRGSGQPYRKSVTVRARGSTYMEINSFLQLEHARDGADDAHVWY